MEIQRNIPPPPPPAKKKKKRKQLYPGCSAPAVSVVSGMVYKVIYKVVANRCQPNLVIGHRDTLFFR